MKLGQAREALHILEELHETHPNHTLLLESTASLYLIENKPKKAKPLIEKLMREVGETPAVLQLLGDFQIQQSNWTAANATYYKLLAQSPQSRQYQEAYAQTLSGLRRWSEAKRMYKTIVGASKTQNPILVSDYLNVVEQGSPQLQGRFTYYHRPSGQRDTVLQEGGEFWLYPWLQMGVGLSEEYYTRRAIGDLPVTRKFLFSHNLEARLFYASLAKLSLRWRETYYDHETFPEFGVTLQLEKGIWRGEIAYEWNHVARDPIEGLDKHGLVDHFKVQNSLLLFKRIEVGHQFLAEWFRLQNGFRNQINGSDHLGYKLTNDLYAQYKILDKPNLYIRYQYRDGSWDKKFPNAEQVIDYLAEVQEHSGGFYMDQRFGPYVELRGGIIRGSDRKRDANFVIWLAEADIRIKDSMMLTLSYEYDYGDSGTAGSGNSSVSSINFKWFF